MHKKCKRIDFFWFILTLNMFRLNTSFEKTLKSNWWNYIAHVTYNLSHVVLPVEGICCILFYIVK